MGGLGKQKPQLPITSAHHVEKRRKFWLLLSVEELSLSQMIYWQRFSSSCRSNKLLRAPLIKHKEENVVSSWHWAIFGIPHYFMQISTEHTLQCTPLSVDASEEKEWRCNTSAEKLSTHFRSMHGSNIYFYRKTFSFKSLYWNG